jgi:VRR-NUC domain
VTTTRATLDRYISEPAFQRQVLQLAHLCGWAAYHTHDSRHSEAGWPDLALCRPPRLLLVELKSSRGRVSQAQRRWLDLLGQCPGVECYLLRPADWDAITEVLR